MEIPINISLRNAWGCCVQEVLASCKEKPSSVSSAFLLVNAKIAKLISDISLNNNNLYIPPCQNCNLLLWNKERYCTIFEKKLYDLDWRIYNIMVGVFDMPNPNLFNMLFKNILNIVDIDIFKNGHIDIDIDMDIFQFYLLISIFSKLPY